MLALGMKGEDLPGGKWGKGGKRDVQVEAEGAA